MGMYFPNLVILVTQYLFTYLNCIIRLLHFCNIRYSVLYSLAWERALTIGRQPTSRTHLLTLVYIAETKQM